MPTPREAQLEEQLRQARETLKEQAEFIEQLKTPPFPHGTVIRVTDKAITLTDGRGQTEHVKPPQLKLTPGDTVLFNPTAGIILDKIEDVVIGSLLTVSRVTQSHIHVGQMGGGERLMLIKPGLKVEEGDQVAADTTGSVAIHVVPRKKMPPENTGVAWDDIGGQEEAKMQMIEAVEMPYTHANIFSYYGKKPIKGLMLEGPPGCGKTMLAKAASTALSKVGKGTSAFIYVKGPEILDPYVGVTEANVRGLFNRAREHYKLHGTRAVIMIDEAESIMAKRGDHHTSFMSSTVVPSFLTEMDGMEDSAAIVILATNRPDRLDPAIVREGRIDRKVSVKRPNQADTEAIIGIHLRKVPTNHDRRNLAKAAANAVFNGGHNYYDCLLSNGNTLSFGLHHLISGAMAAGIVEQAMGIAMRRDVKSGKRSGVSQEDMLNGVRAVFRANRDIDHSDDLARVVGSDTKIVNLREINDEEANAAVA